jgi:hypothetical protein
LPLTSLTNGGGSVGTRICSWRWVASFTSLSLRVGISIPGNHRRGGWMGPWAALGEVKRGKNLATTGTLPCSSGSVAARLRWSFACEYGVNGAYTFDKTYRRQGKLDVSSRAMTSSRLWRRCL